MKILHSKKHNKIIITIILAIMLCNFIMPNYSIAKTDTDGGGSTFAPMSKFLTFICDDIFQFLQETFISLSNIDQKDGTYEYRYSPAIIFSGTVPALDIDFINPNTEVIVSARYEDFVSRKAEEWASALNIILNCKDKGEEVPDSWGHVADAVDQSYDFTNANNFAKAARTKGAKLINKTPAAYSISKYWAYYWDDELGNVHVECKFKRSSEYYYYGATYSIGEMENVAEDNEYASYESIANILKGSIASWYKALRRVALVGLLSALVYIGIRVVINSAAGEDNSKYKQMLSDWLVAMCLLFTLHYLMNLIIMISKQLLSIFAIGTTDPLLNNLRQEIYKGSSWNVVMSKVIIYIVLTIYTVTFTFQYIKRVLYMSFFTMIAPLIALTYPLDKIRDGQAQAFNMWMREYIFNALIPVLHILLYYVLIMSAETLVVKYPLIAIVAIGFMSQGERIIRKMFGFENVSSMGSLKAAATGGLIMGAMNKVKQMPNLSSQSESGSSGGKNSGGKKRKQRSQKTEIVVVKSGSGGAKKRRQKEIKIITGGILYEKTT